jgi:hypothetical protein
LDDKGNLCRAAKGSSAQSVTKILGDAREGNVAMVVRIRPAVGAAGTASVGTGSERFLNDRLDGARATAALGAATETSVDLLGVAGKIFRCTDRVADIVVGQDVAGTNNHEEGAPVWLFGQCFYALQILKSMSGCKRKNCLLKLFQTGLQQI